MFVMDKIMDTIETAVVYFLSHTAQHHGWQRTVSF